MSNVLKCIVAVVLFVLCCHSLAADGIHPDAPQETHQFATMLGVWQIEDYQLQENGEWQAGEGAAWEWHTILNGYGIQDTWIAPLPRQQGQQPSFQYGTNIRVYNPRKNQWEMAWVSSTGLQLDTFTAQMVNDELVMIGNFSGKPSRITFYDMTHNSFRWKLAIKEGDQWQDVYRIKGSR